MHDHYHHHHHYCRKGQPFKGTPPPRDSESCMIFRVVGKNGCINLKFISSTISNSSRSGWIVCVYKIFVCAHKIFVSPYPHLFVKNTDRNMLSALTTPATALIWLFAHIYFAPLLLWRHTDQGPAHLCSSSAAFTPLDGYGRIQK